MSLFHLFIRYFMCAAGIISGAVISVVVYGALLNKWCEWSLEKDLKKRQVERNDKDA